MLSFANAYQYDSIVSMDESELMSILAEYQDYEEFTSMAEIRGTAEEDSIYTPLISCLLNENNMIHIENRVYKINAERGYVYSCSSEYIDDEEVISSLASESYDDEIIFRHSAEEDLWEISGLPYEKSGPGGGCPTIPASQLKHTPGVYSQTYNTSVGCTVGNNTANVKLWTYLRYYRYGILFELVGRSRETDLWGNLNGGVTCNTITLYSPTCTFKRNRSSYVYNLPAKTTSAKGEVKYKPYSGGNRLCWFYWTEKTSRSAVNKETSLVSLYHNYTP